MHVPTPRTILSASTALALLGAWTLTPTQAGTNEITHQPVAGNVHVLFGNGGNIGASVGPDGTLLVDDQYMDMAPAITAALDELDGAAEGRPRFVLNTHVHGDHTGSNPVFGTSAIIVAHQNVRARLLDPERAMEPAGLPVVTYADSVTLHVNGEDVRLVHYPEGHTDGDSVVFFEGSNVVHMGDLFFNGRFPYIDRDRGGSASGMIAAVRSILPELDPDVRIVPGHGPLATRADLEDYLEMLETCQGLVAEALEAGDDVDAMLANGLLDEYESLSWAFINTQRFLTGLVAEARAR